MYGLGRRNVNVLFRESIGYSPGIFSTSLKNAKDSSRWCTILDTE